jgi:Holliday junction resolvase RusA-like endonuclease
MIVKVTPVGKPRMTQRDKWKYRPAVARYRTYCDVLRLSLPGYELGLSLHVIFYLPIPKSYSKKKRAELLGTLHGEKPDIDNLAKGFMDAFKAEDKQVAILRAEKYWAETGSVEIL